MPREQRPLMLLVALLVLVALVLEHVNGRFWLSDLRVYWGAANALLHGQPMYGSPFGESTGFYKYAPVVAIGFVPLAMLPFSVAATIWFVLIGLAVCLCSVRLEQLLMRFFFGIYAPRVFVRGLLGLLCIVVLLSRELHLGNINVWIVVGTLFATEAMLEDRPANAGSLFGALWILKPYLLVMAIPLLLYERWNVLRAAGITSIALLLLPSLFVGPSVAWNWQVQWIHAMLGHGSYLSSPNTFRSILDTWTGMHPDSGSAVLIAAMLLLSAVLLNRWSAMRARTMASEGYEALGLWMALAVVPNLVITDTEHFLFALPIIGFVIAHLFIHRDPWVAVLFTAAMLLYATRSSDLLGGALFEASGAYGVLGIGNVLLLVAARIASINRNLA